MRSLSPALLAAQQGPARRPYLEVVVQDQVAGIPRRRLERLYTGSEADWPHALTVPGDGSLVRAWSNLLEGIVRVMRVPNPGPGSNFATWTPLGAVSPYAGVALTSLGAEVLLFYSLPSPDYDKVYYRQSLDYGQTWGSPVSLGAGYPGMALRWVAAGHTPQGDVALFAASQTIIQFRPRGGGSWGALGPLSSTDE